MHVRCPAGFERSTIQSELDFVLDIAADKGKMKLVGGKRGNALSPEDLADLNRSLVNIKAGRKKEEDAHVRDAAEDLEHEFQALQQPHWYPLGGAGDARPLTCGWGFRRPLPTASTAVMLIGRGLHAALSDVSFIPVRLRKSVLPKIFRSCFGEKPTAFGLCIAAFCVPFEGLTHAELSFITCRASCGCGTAVCA
jgi:hypothetical protein